MIYDCYKKIRNSEGTLNIGTHTPVHLLQVNTPSILYDWSSHS